MEENHVEEIQMQEPSPKKIKLELESQPGGYILPDVQEHEVCKIWNEARYTPLKTCPQRKKEK